MLYDYLCYKNSERAEIDGTYPAKPCEVRICYLSEKSKLTEEQWLSLVVKKFKKGKGTGEDPNDHVVLNTWREFLKKIKKKPQLLNHVMTYFQYANYSVENSSYRYGNRIAPVEDVIPTMKILNSKSFGELSKANQVYLIAQSNYFTSSSAMDDGEKYYGIQYSYEYLFDDKVKANADYLTPGQGMKKLFLCKSLKGVCSVYAKYEKLLFDQLGIAAWECSNNEIGHAWSVVKVKNALGKTLWVPFDYGIGPAPRLILDEKIRKRYLRTEKMRYRLYLGGIKGAPKYKNFALRDFV